MHSTSKVWKLIWADELSIAMVASSFDGASWNDVPNWAVNIEATWSTFSKKVGVKAAETTAFESISGLDSSLTMSLVSFSSF